VKEIDELSGEYWQILDIDEQQEKLRQETRETDGRCEILRAQLEEIQGREEEKLQEMKESKAKRMDEALALMREIEELKEWKEVTKRKFVTLKAKLKVIRKHEGEASDLQVEIEKTKVAMAKLKQDFATDLASIQSKTETIEAIEKKVDEIEKEIVEAKTRVKEETAELANEVSKLSKQIAELSAKIGALENTKADFFYQIGHFLSNNIDSKDRTIREALRKHRQLVSRISYFRRSIAFNQRLARRTNP
jgi:chromosome segregation ATPase